MFPVSRFLTACELGVPSQLLWICHARCGRRASRTLTLSLRGFAGRNPSLEPHVLQDVVVAPSRVVLTSHALPQALVLDAVGYTLFQVAGGELLLHVHALAIEQVQDEDRRCC